MSVKRKFNIIFDGEKIEGFFIDTLDALNWLKFEHLKGDVKKLTGKKLIIKAI